MERSQRAFAVGIAIGLVFFTTALGFAVYTSVTLQVGAGFTALQAGLAFAPAGVAFFGASLLAPKLVPRLGRYVLSLGYAVLCLGMLATALTIQLAGPSLTVWTLAPALLIVGTGQGLGMSPLIGSVLSGIRHQDTGSAAGALTTSFQLGQTLGIAVVGMIFFPLVGHVSANGPVGSYLYAYQISVLTLAGLAVLLFSAGVPAAAARVGVAPLRCPAGALTQPVGRSGARLLPGHRRAWRGVADEQDPFPPPT
jgi:MFS family permease